ncbi:BON domain-containing protein [Thiohalocapsa halophila]|nr:BON domain-containing protein [Thiohalocapsa halophila]
MMHTPSRVRSPLLPRFTWRASRRAVGPGLAAALGGLLLAAGGVAIAQDLESDPPGVPEPVTAVGDAQPEHTGVEAPPGSELWTEARLLTTYSLNEHLNPFDIDVGVDGDTVTLSGIVDTPVARDLAVLLARDLSGVDKVVDRLQVAPPGQTERTVNPFYRSVTEANTSARVKLQLLWREPVYGLLVDVTTSGDTVILSGDVRSAEDKALAERIARRTEGVAAVESQLTVDPDATVADEAREVMTSAAEQVSDAWLTARVAASLRFDRTLDAARVDVTTRDGVVTLSGQVPTAADKREAAELAAAIDGVARVENLIAVDGPEA